jgi:hypothetical protein
MKIFCFHCEYFHFSGECAYTMKEFNAVMAKTLTMGEQLSSLQVVGPKHCAECRIALSAEQSTKERAETERPGLCDCCRSMIEALGQPQVKEFFGNAHLEWDSENDRRIGLIRGKV